MERLKRVFCEFWPLVVAILLVPVQTDLLIATSGKWTSWLGVGPAVAVLFVVIIGTGKMYFSYRLWGWLRDLITDTERFQHFADVAKQAARLIWAEGFVDRALASLKLRHDQAHSYGKKLLTTARWGGSLFLFGAGLYPMWGVRAPLVVVIGVKKWHGGLCALALGSALRTAYLMGGLTLLLNLVR